MHEQCGWNSAVKNKSVSGNGLKVLGKGFADGIGTHQKRDVSSPFSLLHQFSGSPSQPWQPKSLFLPVIHSRIC
ncbi:MAG: hypothetical protein HGA72_03280 [Chlorobiaceae bacterium]|nr:hypothetical protein [Chlorobiaceae bacterium]